VAVRWNQSRERQQAGVEPRLCEGVFGSFFKPLLTIRQSSIQHQREPACVCSILQLQQSMRKDWEQAMRSGDADFIGRLIAQGADANSKDRHGQTALMIASTKGLSSIVNLLVENQAELDHTAKYNLSALMLAVVNNHSEIVKLLVKAGADLAIRGTGAPGFSGFTALELAERAGRVEIAAILTGNATPEIPEAIDFHLGPTCQNAP
jgi:ankyrin repeat protein